MTRLAHRVTCLICTAWLLACGVEVPLLEPGESSEYVFADPEEPDGSQAALDAFFTISTVHRISIAVDDTGVSGLLAAPKAYVPGSVTVDDVLYDGVGVKLKGNATFVPLDGEYSHIGENNGAPGKSPFVIDFNRFASGQTLLGLQKLSLNNMAQDPSCVREHLSYSLFRAMGVPASRTGYAIVTFNGQEKGLYLMVENTDNKALLRRWFGSTDGTLYEGEIPIDLYADQIGSFDQDHGKDKSKADLVALVAALDALGPSEDPWTVLDTWFDMDEYVNFAATEVYLNHWDGYVGGHPNNYFIHHDAGGPWSFLPWGLDTSLMLPQHAPPHLAAYGGIMQAPGPAWSDRPRVQELCYRSATCRARMKEAIEAVIEGAKTLDFAALAAAARAVVEPLALIESTAYGNAQLTSDTLDQVASFIATRETAVSAWLPCLAGQMVDQNSDGIDDCSVAPEHVGGEPGPGECVEIEGAPYVVCLEPRSWSDARARCQERGLDLAVVADQAALDQLTTALAGFFEEPEHLRCWIGLSDQEAEGQFRWVDGSAPVFTPWAPDAPAGEDADQRDCVRLSMAGWGDRPCEVPYPFACGPVTMAQ